MDGRKEGGWMDLKWVGGLKVGGRVDLKWVGGWLGGRKEGRKGG